MKFTTALILILVSEANAFSTSYTRRIAFANKSVLHPRSSRVVVHGILDEINSDAYDLSSTKASDNGNNMEDAYEIFLADLVFSTNDPRVDIVNKFELAGDPNFSAWLEKKTESSRDPEERVALRDLLKIIIDIKTRIEVNRLAEERAEREKEAAEKVRMAAAEAQADDGRKMSTADILKKATQIQTAEMRYEEQTESKKKTTFYDAELTPEIRLSYEGLLKTVLPPYQAGQSPASIVFANYDQFDAQFVKVLSERANNGDEDAQKLLDALAVEQRKRIEAATNALKEVLSLGEPKRMEGAIIKMAREGKIDEPFLLLLEANENQARAAGANGPANLMNKLRIRAMDEKDKQATSKEIRLLRKLLRTEDQMEREKILEEAFTPKAALIVPGSMENARRAADGEAPEQEKPMPDVPPPDFINACKAVMLNFGNLGDYDEDRGDLATRIKKLASEAEVVATRIYGQGMSVREQQDRMWEDQTTSIFDLERMEIEAERRGDKAPWTNPNDDDMFLPGFDKDGRMQIGGS